MSTGVNFPVTFRNTTATFRTTFGSTVPLQEYEDYQGSYDVTPMVTSQRLETADKHMLDDVLIRTIPTKEIDNNAGGTTFVIGGA